MLFLMPLRVCMLLSVCFFLWRCSSTCIMYFFSSWFTVTFAGFKLHVATIPHPPFRIGCRKQQRSYQGPLNLAGPALLRIFVLLYVLLNSFPWTARMFHMKLNVASHVYTIENDSLPLYCYGNKYANAMLFQTTAFDGSGESAQYISFFL